MSNIAALNNRTTVSWYNKGTIYLQNKRYDKALACFKKEDLEFKELFLNMGNAYRGLGDFENAKKCYIKANDSGLGDVNGVRGEYAPALGNLGLLSYMIGQDADAGWYCNRALVIDPLHYMTIWNFSLVLLREYCSGGSLHKDAWKMHEYRFKAVKDIDHLPRWDGKRVDKLLILNEQGMGDKLMYGRYLKYLEKYVDEIVVQCPVEMDCFFKYRTCRTVSESGCSVGIPFGVLPRMFPAIPSGKWLEFPSKKLEGFNIAVEWAGNPNHVNDANRSTYAGYFSKLAMKFPNAKFYNLRPGAPTVRGIESINCANWEETASWVSSMDLVISVDTSLVHLAGSLGVECWMLQPLVDTDFRWGNPSTKKLRGMDIESNLWYESVKVIENKGWEELFTDLEYRVRSRIGFNAVTGFGGTNFGEFLKYASNSNE